MAEIKIYATPSLLFRYRPLTAGTVDRELAAIREGYVFCPRFDQMNDPMEGLHRESSLFQKAQDYEDRKAAIEAAVNSHGIASFSEVHDHEPMWAHYADQFKGMCVAYRFTRLLSGLPKSAEFVRMAYSEEAPVLLKGRKTNQQLAKLILSTKTIRWSPEREWRLIRPSSGAAEYGDVGCVQKVYVGARIDPDVLTQVRREMGALGIPVERMEVDQYAMEFTVLARIKPPPKLKRIVIRKALTPTKAAGKRVLRKPGKPT
jgi:hypothetical protein